MKTDRRQIDLIVYDFDGVMTDNRVLVLEDGREAVFCNRSDGLAIARIKSLGIPQLILSTETNKVVAARSAKLGLEVLHGVNDKKTVLAQYCATHGYLLDRVVFIGNDVNDLDVMNAVGMPLCPSDAHETIRAAASVIGRKGGDGVIRAFYDEIFNG